ncbi:MAG: hypothetical protein ACLQLG_16215 [Thermoguttaceae bacterium]
MKKAIVSVILCATLVGGVWLVRQVWGQTTEKEEAVTMTKSQFEKLVEARVAEALKAKTPQDTDKVIHRAENWHTAIYNGSVFTIYTGPGVVALALPDQRGQRGPAPRPGAATQKPAASKAMSN